MTIPALPAVGPSRRLIPCHGVSPAALGRGSAETGLRWRQGASWAVLHLLQALGFLGRRGHVCWPQRPWGFAKNDAGDGHGFCWPENPAYFDT